MSFKEQLISAINARKIQNVGKLDHLDKLWEKMDLDDVNKILGGVTTALHLACRKNYNEIVDLLVGKNGIDVNVKGIGRETPLHVAVRYNNAHAVKKILTNPQVEVNAQNDIRLTPLHIACANNYHQIVLELLGSPGLDANVQDVFGRTPLHLACENNHYRIVFELLGNSGIDVNVRGRNGITPVMLSALRCDEEVLKLLLGDTRVDLDAKDEEGRGLEAQVGRSQEDSKTKEKCLQMIKKERRKRENGSLEDDMIGQRIEKIEKLNKEMGDLHQKLKDNVDFRNQKRDLNERQSSEKKMMTRKHKEDKAALKKKYEEEETKLEKKHEEEETTMNKRHKIEQTTLETTLARKEQAEKHHMAILGELRDELAQDIQKLTNGPVQDTSGDRVKLEAAEKSLECPICMDLMRPPTRIWMCPLSHIICEPCKDGLDKKDNRGKCPTCMTERVNLRALMAESFARTIFNE